MTNASQLTGPVAVAAQGIYSESSTALHRLGELIHSNDGRAFRYTKVGVTALAAGKIYEAAAEDTSNQQDLTCAANAVGDLSVVTTTTVTLAANLLAEGFLTVTSASTGAGFTYKITGNTVAAGAVTTFTLADPIVVATTGTVKVDVKKNPYDAVIITPAGTATSAPVGVAVYNVTAAYYGWLQTHGPASILCSTTITVGNNIMPLFATAAGAASAAVDGVKSSIGYALTGIATTEYGLVYLTID
jgi:hypothetical protein